MRILLSADLAQDLGDALISSAATAGSQADRKPPTVTVEAEANDVDSAHPQRGVEVAPLREVADLVAVLAGLTAEHLHRSVRGGVQAQQHFDEGRLADPVG